MNKKIPMLTIALLLPLLMAIPQVMAAPVPPPDGLVSWWPGDENADDVWKGNDGTLMNGATFAAGMVSEAFSLDGVDDFVNIPDNPTLDITEAVTIDVWIKVPPVSTGDIYGILDKGDSAFIGGAYSLRLSHVEDYDLPNAGPNLEGRANFLIWIGDPSTWPSDTWHINSQTRIDDDNWHFIAATYDGSMMKMYVDGNLETTFSISGSIRPTNIDLTFGNRLSSYLRGLIDEVEICNRALSAAEIQALYDARDSGKIKPTTPGQKASVNVVPASATIGINDELVLNVTVSDVPAPGLYAYQFKLHFDPAILEVFRAEIPTDHMLKPSLKPSNIFIVDSGTIDKVGGFASFFVTLLSDEPGKTGSGVLCTIALWGKAVGSSSVTLEDVILVDGEGAVPGGNFTLNNGTVTVQSSGAWDYSFSDSSGKGTLLNIDTANGLFQFITPDRDYGTRKATGMQIGKTIVTNDGFMVGSSTDIVIWIMHEDTELRLTALAFARQDLCWATAKDLQTNEVYRLIRWPWRKR